MMLYWLQIKADMLDAVMISVENEEPACKGAAMLAACGAGWEGFHLTTAMRSSVAVLWILSRCTSATNFA
jgi:sugar (pentulose or hexulose) kinase